MCSFILQLLVISAFGLMAQSAPVNDVTKDLQIRAKQIFLNKAYSV